MKTRTNYQQMLVSNNAESTLLFNIPWMLDAFRQDPVNLQRALILENKRYEEVENPVFFSLITPLYNTSPRLLQELIASVRLQSFPFWELLLRDDASPKNEHLEIAKQAAADDQRIKVIEGNSNLGIGAGRDFLMQHAKGDYFVILDHDDLIHPQALGILARSLATNKDVNFVYTNEAKIDETGKKVFDFLSKPDFDKFTLHRINYICHLSCTSSKLVEALRARDGFAWSNEFDGAEDHDFFLRLSTLPNFRPLHIPLFAYYWRATTGSTALNPKAKASLDERRALLLKPKLDSLYGQNKYSIKREGELGRNGFVSIHPQFEPSVNEFILVIVPFHNSSDLTIRCLESLLTQDSASWLKVILVDNNSSAEESQAVKSWVEAHPNLKAHVVEFPVAFNFAKINNFAFNRFSSESSTVLFLNNDVEILSSNAISVMAAHLKAHEECGFVGIRLMYPGGDDIQHGGIRAVHGTHGSGYVNIGHATHSTEFVYDERISMGVTFACAMVRCETFRKLEGLEEILLPNGFGDVDIALRAMKLGKVNHYYGTLFGIHHESKTRKLSSEEFEFATLHARHGAIISNLRIKELSLKWIHSKPDNGRLQGTHDSSQPLRYRIADKVNKLLKLIFGQFHLTLKKTLRKTLFNDYRA